MVLLGALSLVQEKPGGFNGYTGIFQDLLQDKGGVQAVERRKEEHLQEDGSFPDPYSNGGDEQPDTSAQAQTNKVTGAKSNRCKIILRGWPT